MVNITRTMGIINIVASLYLLINYLFIIYVANTSIAIILGALWELTAIPIMVLVMASVLLLIFGVIKGSIIFFSRYTATVLLLVLIYFGISYLTLS